tara:strand:- start:2203 stop:3153 length:951 start_codon:yes stop_codon:yes gene_type:complete
MNWFRIKIFKKNQIVSIILLFFLVYPNISYALKNKVLFKINNEIITSIDLLEETKYLISMNNELENANKEVIYEIAKRSLIKHKIKEIELINRLEDYKLDENILSNIILDQFKKKNIRSKEELDKFFKNKKINRNHVNERIKTEILWNELIFAKYSKQIKVDQEEIKKELKNKKKQKEFLLSEILFNVEKNEKINEKLKAIEELILKKGFSEAALTFSVSGSSDKGGRLEWIKETSLNKKIRSEINSLQIGNYTKPIVIPGGFLILKVDDIKISEIDINIDELINEISKKKFNEQLTQFSTIYFNKIKKNITVYEY